MTTLTSNDLRNLPKINTPLNNNLHNKNKLYHTKLSTKNLNYTEDSWNVSNSKITKNSKTTRQKPNPNPKINLRKNQNQNQNSWFQNQPKSTQNQTFFDFKSTKNQLQITKYVNFWFSFLSISRLQRRPLLGSWKKFEDPC